MVSTHLRARGQLTIPSEIRKAAHLEEGDLIDVEMTGDGVLLRPRKEASAIAHWLKPPEGKARVRDAIDAIVAGREWIFQDGEEFLAVLKQLPPADADV